MAGAVHALREALEEQQAKCGMLMKDNRQLQAARAATAAAEAAQAAAEGREREAAARMASAEEAAAVVAERLGTEARLRRHLHNVIQQLKGNVRVCVRTRPMIGDEAARAEGGECDQPPSTLARAN
jgi:hypothetical protein|eukprot:COSAG01_NODE_3242_length_6367_cov_4.192725_1_plen_126_part_00